MASYHVRSTSLPSASHPLTVNAEKRLERLKSSQATSSFSYVSICHNLSGLVELYDSVDDVLHLSKSQSHGKRVDEVLDGSLRLLDVCDTIRDALSQMKESVLELESSLRRKRGGDSGLSNEVGAYMISRKKLNKLIYKSFDDLKRMEKSYSTRSLERDSLSSMLGEIDGINLTVFNSLLSFISLPKERSKSLSFISKLLQSKLVFCEEDINEVEKLDIDLLVLKSKRSTKIIDLQQVQNVVKKLQPLAMNIQELEEGLEAVFRRLVKTRVSLLNILNN